MNKIIKKINRKVRGKKLRDNILGGKKNTDLKDYKYYFEWVVRDVKARLQQINNGESKATLKDLRVLIETLEKVAIKDFGLLIGDKNNFDLKRKLTRVKLTKLYLNHQKEYKQVILWFNNYEGKAQMNQIINYKLYNQRIYSK